MKYSKKYLKRFAIRFIISSILLSSVLTVKHFYPEKMSYLKSFVSYNTDFQSVYESTLNVSENILNTVMENLP